MRVHRIYRCKRCQNAFHDDPALVDHQREETPCQLTDPVSQENYDWGLGFDEVQAGKLRKRTRKRARAGADCDEQRWLEWYKILFPQDAKIPSPCKCAGYSQVHLGLFESIPMTPLQMMITKPVPFLQISLSGYPEICAVVCRLSAGQVWKLLLRKLSGRRPTTSLQRATSQTTAVSAKHLGMTSAFHSSHSPPLPKQGLLEVCSVT